MASRSEPSSGEPDEPAVVRAVRAAHQGFYDAFEARDMDAMSEVWEHSDRVVCTHPGWRTLRGWGAVSGSWFALFGGPSPLQFILTEEVIIVDGDLAWVSVDENLIGAGQGEGPGTELGATVAALNLFRRHPGPGGRSRWLLVAHHGSPVAPHP
jgi:ketosteroid isomerase-like protein